MKSIFKSGYSTSSIIGLMNEFEELTTIAPRVLQDCTINTKRNIIPGVVPTKIPQLYYFGMGINGYYNVSQKNPPISQPYIPKATDMDLYESIPFRTVPIDSDISPEERTMYRIRTRETFNGEDYFCYWLKKINFLDGEVKVMKVDGDTHKEEPYVFDNKHLWPVPDPDYTGDIVDANGDTVVIYLKGSCEILGSEVLESISVIYDGDLRRAAISEFGFYTGEDVTNKGDDGAGGTIDYTESAYTQMCAKRCTLGIPITDAGASHVEQITYINSNIINV